MDALEDRVEVNNVYLDKCKHACTRTRQERVAQFFASRLGSLVDALEDGVELVRRSPAQLVHGPAAGALDAPLDCDRLRYVRCHVTLQRRLRGRAMTCDARYMAHHVFDVRCMIYDM